MRYLKTALNIQEMFSKMFSNLNVAVYSYIFLRCDVHVVVRGVVASGSWLVSAVVGLSPGIRC